MSAQREKLRPGDLVELRPPDEIASTLDGDGARDRVPFMPEMLGFYRRRLRIARRALTVCYYGPGPQRGFAADTVVTLEDVRCSGAAHDGCPKACVIFWHEAWLQKTADAGAPAPVDPTALEALRQRLKVSTDPKTYYCQASELLRATHAFSRTEKLARYARGLGAGNFSALQMAKSIGIYAFLWGGRKLFGVRPRGPGAQADPEPLNLQAGEWVEVKPLQGIAETLDHKGHNNGLWFTPEMARQCGRRMRVKGRIEKIIVDGTGKQRKLRDTVLLEGSTCGCAYLGFGMDGCARNEFIYWREAWLRRCEAPAGEPN